MKINQNYSICAIDIGSPRKENLGWCFIEANSDKEICGSSIDDIFCHLENTLKSNGLILGFEAPLFVPVRSTPKHLTNARKGEKNRPWSAGAGAIVLAINLPIMVYVFERIKSISPDASFHLDEKKFKAQANQIMIFEAFISGNQKDRTSIRDHIEDARKIAKSCKKFSKCHKLPCSILEHEEGTHFFNLAAAALLRCELENKIDILHSPSPIYRP